MPYSVPAQGRPGHRRSFGNVSPPSLASTSTTGAFASLGALPTRRRPTRPVFHFGREDDDIDERDEFPQLPPLQLKSKFVSSFDNQQPAPAAATVPFPRSSPLPSPTIPDKPPSPDPPLVRPFVSRCASTPILLSNGKSLKSSLRSSSSLPNIHFPSRSLVPSILSPELPTHHQQACSSPATPNLDPQAPNPSASPSSIPQSPTKKSVHFQEGGLTTKRSTNRASFLCKGDETETETEGESSSSGFGLPFAWGSGWNHTGNRHIPKKPNPLPAHEARVKEEAKFEIDMKNSSPVPARAAVRKGGNVYFETLSLISDSDADNPAKPLTLTGTILVRNVAYHKTVTVRYTLDDWITTHDVIARHEKSLAALPERFLLASLPLVEEVEECPEGGGRRRRGVKCKPAWDRFRFEISLEKYESSIQRRTMWFVGRYSTAPPVNKGGSIVPAGEGEWWDNNSGNNYRVAFVKRVVKGRVKEEGGERMYGEASYGARNRRNVVFGAPLPSLSVTYDTDEIEGPTPTPMATTPSAFAASPMEIGKGRGRATVKHEPADLVPTPTHISSDNCVGTVPETQIAPPAVGKRKRKRKSKKSEAVIDSNGLLGKDDKGKLLAYLLSIFSAEVASKPASTPQTDEQLLSKEPWDKLLANISNNLEPQILDFDNCKIMYFLHRLVPKPVCQRDNYVSRLTDFENSSNKVTPAIDVIVEQKTTSKEKENLPVSTGSNTTVTRKKKKKKNKVSPGNLNNLAGLQERWKCVNSGCIGAYCYVNNTTGDHFPLKQSHFECWAAAMLKGDGSATLEKPPKHLLFDPELSQVSPILEHHLDAENANATAPGSSALEGMIDIIHALIIQCPSDAPAQDPEASIQPLSEMLFNPVFGVGADISIAQFCEDYGLHAAIHKKLDENGCDYARNLRFISLDSLTEMGFKPGEKAALQDAVERWAVRRA